VIITLKTGQNGYSASQVKDRAMTVGDLIEQLEMLRDDLGEDTQVIVQTYGNGAVWEPVLVAEDDYSDEDSDEDW